MNWFGVSITYAVCWWLVLFMVLPWGVRLAETPEIGHARSAPARPMLRKKLLITSLLTLIPTLAFYIVISEAKAAEPAMYSTSNAGGTKYSTKHAGQGCKPATLPNDSGSVPVDINVPIAPYFDASKQGSAAANGNAAVSSQGSLGIGKGQVNRDGSLTVNGQRLGAANPLGDCPPDDTDASDTKEQKGE